MSGVENLDILGSTVEKYASRVFQALKDSKDNPVLLGLELLTIATGLRIAGIDFVVFDFSGQHIDSPQKQIQKAQAQYKAQTGKDLPIPGWLNEGLQIGLDIGSLVIPGGNLLAAPFASELNAIVPGANLSQPGLPNLLSLLGLKLPTQITLSELIMLGGILLMAEPLLKTLAGSISSLLKSAAPALLG